MAPIPQYFLVRPDIKLQNNSGVVVRPGALVPLIAVDQLPEWIDIAGVPRNLELKDVSGMINLGRGIKSDGLYDIRLHMETVLKMTKDSEDESTVNGNAATIDTSVGNKVQIPDKRDAPIPLQRTAEIRALGHRTLITEIMKEHVTTKPTRPHVINGQPHTLSQISEHSPELMLQASRHAVPETPPSSTTRHEQLPLSPSLRGRTKTTKLERPIQEKVKDTDYLSTSYCRHWCHHGTCKWGLNCRYEHTMPTTLEGLQEVGLQGFPSWFITAMGLTLSGMGMAPMNLGMGTMGVRPLVSHIGLFGHLGGNGAKKAKRTRDAMTMIPSSNTHAKTNFAAKAQNLEHGRIKEMEGLQTDGGKSDMSKPGLHASNAFGNASMQIQQDHSLPALRPLREATTSDQVIKGSLGDGRKGTEIAEEKLLDI